MSDGRGERPHVISLEASACAVDDINTVLRDTFAGELHTRLFINTTYGGIMTQMWWQVTSRRRVGAWALSQPTVLWSCRITTITEVSIYTSVGEPRVSCGISYTDIDGGKDNERTCLLCWRHQTVDTGCRVCLVYLLTGCTVCVHNPTRFGHHCS